MNVFNWFLLIIIANIFDYNPIILHYIFPGFLLIVVFISFCELVPSTPYIWFWNLNSLCLYIVYFRHIPTGLIDQFFCLFLDTGFSALWVSANSCFTLFVQGRYSLSTHGPEYVAYICVVFPGQGAKFFF